MTLSAFVAEPQAKVRLEMWAGCLCGGPDCARTYEQLKAERAKRMLFAKDAVVTSEESKLTPRAFLRKHLDDSKLKDRAVFFWKGVVYRRGSDAKSYSVQFRSLKKLKMADFKDGDLIVYYQEVY
jgi:hypothetical protein